MATLETLRELMNSRLTAMVEEVCGLFTATIAEYEERVTRSKAETEQQRRLIRDVLSYREQPHCADSQMVIKKEQQEWSLDQNALKTLHVKMEEEQPCSSEEGQCVEKSKETPFPDALVNSESQHGYPSVLKDTQLFMCPKQVSYEMHEDQNLLRIRENLETPWRTVDEELTGSGDDRQAECPGSRSQQMETNGEDCGRTQAASQSDRAKTSNSSDCETEDSDDDWKRMPTLQSNLKRMQNTQVPASEPVKKLVSNSDLKTANKEASDSSETEDSDDYSNHRSKPGLISEEVPESSSGFSCQTGKTSHSCSVCGKRFLLKQQLRKHMKTHGQEASGGKRFSHVASDKLSNSSASEKCKGGTSGKRHRTKHLEAKQCCFCDKVFKKKASLILHMKIHKVAGKHKTTCAGGNS